MLPKWRSFYLWPIEYLDNVPLKKVVDFEASLHHYMDTQQKDLLDDINREPVLNEAIEKRIKTAVESFKASSVWQ